MGKRNIFADMHSTREYQVPEIEEGFTITLRNELSVYENRKIFGDNIIGQTDLGNGKVRNEYNFTEIAFAKVLAYLVEWSDKEDIDLNAIKRLDKEVFEVIEKVVDKHEESLHKKRPTTRQKTGNRTESPSDEVTLPSVAP